MTSRERILTALDHREPDRVPLDLGSMMSTIEVEPYRQLKKYLGTKGKIGTFVRDHENICRMYEAAREYGTYPVNLEE